MKNTNKYSIYYLFYILLVFLPIYRDSPLSSYIGVAGYSVLPVVCPILLFIVLMVNNGIIRISKDEKLIFKLALWALCAGLIGTVIWLIQGNNLVTLGEALPVKDIKVFILVAVCPLYLLIFRYCSQGLTEKQIFKPIEIVFWLLTIFCVVEATQIPYAFPWLHNEGQFPYYRIRLLTTESSWTAPIIFNYFMLSLYYSVSNKKRTSTIINILCFGIMCYFTTSKTLLIYVLLSIAIVYFSEAKKMTSKALNRSLPIFIIAIVIGIILVPNLNHSIQGDIENFTSVATRSYTMAMAFILGVIFPFGVGGTYIGFFTELMKSNIGIFDRLSIRLNTSEIIAIYSKNTDVGVMTSAGFMQYNMYWGIIGSFFWARFLIRILKRINNLNLRYKALIFSAFLSNIILSLICVDYNFEFWLLLGVVEYLFIKFEKVR